MNLISITKVPNVKFSHEVKDELFFTFVHLFRSALTIILTILPMIDLGYMINANNSVTDFDVTVVRNVHIVAAIVKIVTYFWALILHILCKKKGLVTSGVLSCFWTVAMGLGILTFRCNGFNATAQHKARLFFTKQNIHLCR